MVARVPVAGPRHTVADVRTRLVGPPYDSVEAVYVLDERRRLLGYVPLRRLLRAPDDARIDHVMRRGPPAVRPDADQADLAATARRHGFPEVPVVDAAGRLLGVVPAPSLIEVLHREHSEDLARLAGVRHKREQAVEALRDRPGRRLRHRLPWLLVGLVGSGVAAWVVSRFAGVLETRVAVAFFLPGIVYLADAIGTQTEAITVRGLSLSEGRFSLVFAGELAAGLLLGSTLALLCFPVIWLAFDDARLAAAVALAIVAAGTVATGIGVALPWALARLGADPAFGSGPVATVIQDVLSIALYFILVQMLLG